MSINFCTELQNFAESRIATISWYATCNLLLYFQQTYWTKPCHTIYVCVELKLTFLLLFNTNNELSGESTGSKSFRILSCNKTTLNNVSYTYRLSKRKQFANHDKMKTETLLQQKGDWWVQQIERVDCKYQLK